MTVYFKGTLPVIETTFLVPPADENFMKQNKAAIATVKEFGVHIDTESGKKPHLMVKLDVEEPDNTEHTGWYELDIMKAFLESGIWQFSHQDGWEPGLGWHYCPEDCQLDHAHASTDEDDTNE